MVNLSAPQGDMMQIEIKIDEKCAEPKVIIMTDKMTDEINEIAKRISEQPPFVLAGFKNSEVTVLDPDKIINIYAANQKVYAVTDNGEYTVRLRIYEIEERLYPLGFVRISNSEIINLKKVKGFDLSFSGTICVNFQDGSTSYVSRRYVAKIKQVFGM
jgi:DNA-binding LytR/AlgR family response regulator